MIIDSHDDGAERMLLGAMIVAPELIPAIRKILADASCFWDERHQTIYKSIVSLHIETGTADGAILSRQMQSDGVFEGAGGESYLLEILNSPVSTRAENVEQYARIVAEKAQRRRILAAGAEAVNAITLGKPIEDALAALEQVKAAAGAHFDEDLSGAVDAAPFPVDCLPAPLRSFAVGMGEAMGIPPEMLAVPALAVCATAIGNSCRVTVNPSWHEPCILWVVLLLDSGELKTPPFKASTRPLVVLQGKANKDYQRRLEEYEEAELAYELQVSTWKKAKGEGEVPVKPQPPVPLDYYTSMRRWKPWLVCWRATRAAGR